MCRNTILGCAVLLVVILGVSSEQKLPPLDNPCGQICEKYRTACVIREHNATRNVPLDGETINDDGIYNTTYWTIFSIYKREYVYAIYSWDNKKPTLGVHSCYPHHGKYVSLDICMNHCIF